MNGTLRIVLSAAAALSLPVTAVAFAAPASLWRDLGVPEPRLGQALTPLGLGVLSCIVATLLKQARGVEYWGVRYYGEAAPPRIAKPSE